MAVTKIWSVKTRLGRTLEYIMDRQKINKKNYKEMHKIDEYNKLDYKDEEILFITSINCNEENMLQDMNATKKRYGKEKGILGFHAIQSFAEGEVEPEVAHEIGIKLAEEIWGDRFEVVVATHVNTNHIHNHFCLNSVSFKDGKKYYDNRETYSELRETSDKLCEEYQLSVIKKKEQPKYKINYDNYYLSYAKKNNYHSTTKEIIDFAIGQADSYKEFIMILQKYNFEIINRAGKLSVRRKPYKKNIRIERAFGSEYSIENIDKRIRETESIKLPFPELVFVSNKKYKFKGKNDFSKKKKAKGLRALYFYYCYLLKVFLKSKEQITPKMQNDIKKMKDISKENRLLARTGIQTLKELQDYKKIYMEKRKELDGKRENLWKRYNRAKDFEIKQEIYLEIQNLSQELKFIKEEVRLVEEIEKRSEQMKENLKEMEEEQENNEEKEKLRNGNIR